MTRRPVYNRVAGPTWRFDVAMRPLANTEFEARHGSPDPAVAPHGLVGQSWDGDEIAVDGAKDDYTKVRKKSPPAGGSSGDGGRGDSGGENGGRDEWERLRAEGKLGGEIGVGSSGSGSGADSSGVVEDAPSAEVWTVAQAEGAIEGVAADYVLASPRATQFKYSRFDVDTPTPPRDVAALGGLKRPVGRIHHLRRGRGEGELWEVDGTGKGTEGERGWRGWMDGLGGVATLADQVEVGFKYSRV